MANYNTIEAEIDSNIVPHNNANLITGAKLNTTLKDIVDTLGDGYRYKGIVTPSSAAITTDNNVFVVAFEAGTYTNYGGLAVSEGIPAVLYYDSSWHMAEIPLRFYPLVIKGLIADEVFVADQLNADADASIGGTLTVEGNTDLSSLTADSASIEDSLAVGGDINIGNDLTVSGGATVNGDASFNGERVYIDGTLEVAGDIHSVDAEINYVIPQAGATHSLVGASSRPYTEGHFQNIDAALALKEDTATVDAKLARKANIDGYYSQMGVGVADDLAGHGASVGAEFTRRRSGGADLDIRDGLARFTTIKGKTIAWNQLVRNGNFEGASGWDAASATFSVSGGVAKVTPNVSNGGIRQTMSLKSGHKYYISYDVNTEGGAGTGYIYNQSGSMSVVVYSDGINHISRLLIPSIDVTYVWLRFPKGAVDYNVSNVQICDLTAMFGSGNEPNAADFKALFPNDYYAYNAGQLLSLNASGIVTDGFNQWDGAKARVFGGKAYYIKGAYTAVKFAKSVDGAQTDVTVADRLFTPSEDGYVFVTGADATTCINFSGPRNGEYEAYWQSTRNLNLTTLTGKVNGQGTSEVIFADGMRGVGSVHDELVAEGGLITKAVKRMGIVDLGSLAWSINTSKPNLFTASVADSKNVSTRYGIHICAKYPSISSGGDYPDDLDKFIFQSGHVFFVHDSTYSDVAAFKAAMSGVYLIYELATPVEYVLDEPINANYLASDMGTETIVPEGVDEDGVPMTAPMVAEIVYSPNAADTIHNLPKNYISKASFDDFTAKLATALNLTITSVWDADNNKYVFTITSNE